MTPAAQGLYDDIKTLGDESEIRIERAKAAVHLIVAYSNVGDMPGAERLHDEIGTLGNEPEVLAVREMAEKYLRQRR